MNPKYDCTADRRTLIACRARIKETRRRYIMMMKRRWLALPLSKRSRFVAEMPERMRSLGMYSVNTYGRDIIRGIIFLWYRSDPDLFNDARCAISKTNWEVGACASFWLKKFARGRDYVDFANMIGLAPDQVYQRRRVWETFADVRNAYPNLLWQHFYAALGWDDAADNLRWANDIKATVAEMKAYRRAQNGEDVGAA